MESDLNENFDLTSKNPTDEALQKLSGIVMNLKRQIRSSDDLLKWLEAQAMERTNPQQLQQLQQQQLQLRQQLRQLQQLRQKDSTDEESDEEGDDEKKDEGGGDKGGGGKGGGGGGSEKKDKPDDSEKKDKEGGGRAGEKKDKTSGELRKMGANKVYGGWFMYGPGTCAEAVLDEPKQEEWLLTVVH